MNGQDINTYRYAYKLSWLKKLHKFTKKLLSQNDKVVLLGDFNIAPTNDDVFDDFNFPANTFTWWDYRSGAFQRNIGYRIDLILVSDKIRKRCSGYFIDKETRHKSWCFWNGRVCHRSRSWRMETSNKMVGLISFLLYHLRDFRI